MQNLPSNLIDYAKSAFLKACQGWTIKYTTPYKTKANSFLVVADGLSMKNVSFSVSLDSKGWLVETL
jgi:hypothetical protein